MLALLGASATAAAAGAIPSAHAGTFTDAERFERWSHFKDVGLPAVVPAHDTLDEAAIADGTCRLLAGASYGGDHFFLQPTRVQRVLDALGNATPPTAGPSRFTLRASDALAHGCADLAAPPAPRPWSDFAVPALGAALSDWYRALCAPASSAAWSGGYDPAYMPQQVVLTAGYVCTVACGLHGKEASATALAALPADAATATCGRWAWDEGTFARLGNASSAAALAAIVAPMSGAACGC